MDDKKKKFVIPEAEIIDFSEEDIITNSDNATDNVEWYFGTGDGNGDDFLG